MSAAHPASFDPSVVLAFPRERIAACQGRAVALALVGRPDAAEREVAACLDLCVEAGIPVDPRIWWALAVARLRSPREALRAAEEGLRRTRGADPGLDADLRALAAFARSELGHASDPWPLLRARLEDGDASSRGVALWLAARARASRHPVRAALLLGHGRARLALRGAPAAEVEALVARLTRELGAEACAQTMKRGAASPLAAVVEAVDAGLSTAPEHTLPAQPGRWPLVAV